LFQDGNLRRFYPGLPRRQRTIARPVVVEGYGLWWGQDVRVEFRPAPPNQGIVFVRRDLPGFPRIPARIEYRVESPRRTCLQRGDVRVEMIEHVMAALAGLEIDNCEIWTTAAEMPGLDGSSAPLVAALQKAGIVEQNALQPSLRIERAVRVTEGDQWLEVRPTTSERSVFVYHLDYGPSSPIQPQVFGFTFTSNAFTCQISDARTFLLRSEAESLRQKGIGRRTSFRDLLVLDQHGPVDNCFRYPDECARHKILDMIGDLALAGIPIVGHFVAYRSGHRLNAKLTEMVLAEHRAFFAERKCA
jgi:UDP-3-O-[3-hydroxymyristoyl] N-acetylglucosamine deacetylase